MSKRKYIEWKQNDLRMKKTFLVQQSVKKGMLTVSWDAKGPIIIAFLEKVEL